MVRSRPGRAAGLVAGVAGTTLALCASTAFATFPGADGRIAFDGDMPNCNGICTVRPDGSRVKQLTSSGSGPSWSASGRRIVFSSGRFIYTMNADGTDRTRVVRNDGYVYRWAAFSPGGGRIVYNRYRANAPSDRRGTIYTIRTDGTDKQRIFASTAMPETPGYSPGGGRIVFSGKPNHRAWGIWTIRPDGTHLRAVTTSPNSYGIHSDHYPDWSPDGKEIAFLRYTDNDPRNPFGLLKFVRPDGSGLHGNGSAGGSRYLYAPSGDRLLSASAGFGGYLSDCYDVFTEPIGGGDRTTVTDNCATYDNGGPPGFATGPSWQPLP